MRYQLISIAVMIVLAVQNMSAQSFAGMKAPSGLVDSDSDMYLTLQVDGYHFNNSDFTAYDAKEFEENKAVGNQNTDDAVSFALSTVRLEMHKSFDKTEFDLTMDRTGYWGNDNLMGYDDGKNPFRFLSLHATARPVTIYELKIGRFDYSIGDARYDYFFSDIIDGVENTITIPLGIDTLKVSVLNEVMSNAAKPSDTYAWSAIDKDEEEAENFQGDTISTRHGLKARYHAGTLFAYYVRYGANTQGAADTSEDGKSSLNEADHDYLFMGGGRAFHTVLGFLSADATFAYSIGKDYQYEGGKEYNGYGTAVNIAVDMSQRGLNVPVLDSFVTSSGYFSPTFCGMKGASPGGMLTYLYKGYFVAPYANFYHFKDYAKDDYEVSTVDATVAKTFVRNSLTTKVVGITTELSNVVFFANEDPDTYVSNIAGEKTRGKKGLTYMGTETQLDISYRIDQMNLYVIGSMYIPSDYYRKKAQVNTYFSDGADIMYGVNVGSSYGFGM